MLNFMSLPSISSDIVSKKANITKLFPTLFSFIPLSYSSSSYSYGLTWLNTSD